MGSFPGILDSIITECIQEMTGSTAGMESYKIAIVAMGSQSEVEASVASVIGFSGEMIKGSLAISSEKSLLDKSHPNHAMGMPVADADLSDWSGEIANQILGRIKNKVSKVGATFSMATPTNMVGKRMQITTPKDGGSLQITVDGPFGQMTIFFLATLDPALVLDGSKAAETAKEGEAILF